MSQSSLITVDLANGLEQFFPMDETSGTTADDKSAEANDGTYSGVTLNDTTSPYDGTGAPFWDGANDHLNGYSAGLAADFNGLENTFFLAAKVNSSGVWVDGVQRALFRYRTNASNQIEIHKRTANNTLRFVHVGGGTTVNYDHTFSSTDWFTVAMTSSDSADTKVSYVNGLAVSTQTAIGTWAGSLTAGNCNIGAFTTTPTGVWHGWLAYFAVWSRVLSAQEIWYIHAGGQPMHLRGTQVPYIRTWHPRIFAIKPYLLTGKVA